jgi:hypothetical protein
MAIDVVTSFKSLANAVRDTDLYKDSVANIDDAFNDNSLSAYEQVELKANFLANITNNALNSAMSLALQEQSANAKLTEELNLIKQQIQESKDKVKMGQDELAKNIELKDKQIFGEDLKNGGVSVEYIYYKSYYNHDGILITTDYFTGDGVDTIEETFVADVTTEVTTITNTITNTNTNTFLGSFVSSVAALNQPETDTTTTTTTTIEAGESVQITIPLFEDKERVKEKILNPNGVMKSVYEADIDYKVTQKRELEQSTRDNRVIKTTQTLESFNSTTGAGGLIPAEATIKRFLELAESIILPSDGVKTTTIEDDTSIIPTKS